MQLTIMFDYGSFAGDVATMRRVAELFKAAGHRLVMITNRAGTPDDQTLITALVGDLMPVLYANGRAKRRVAADHGYTVDIWIEDTPVLIDFGNAGLAIIGDRT